MRRRQFVMCAAIVMCLSVVGATPVAAQGYSTSTKVVFIAPANANTQALAKELTYNLRIDGGTAIALGTVTCTGEAVIQCSAGLPAVAVPFVNAIGARSLTLSAVDKVAGEGPQSSPFVSANKPDAPTGLNLTQ